MQKAHSAATSVIGLFAIHAAIYLPFLAWTRWLHGLPVGDMHDRETVLAGVDCLFVAVLSSFWSFACLGLGSMPLERLATDLLLSDMAEVLPAYISAAFIHVRRAKTRSADAAAEQDRGLATRSRSSLQPG